MCQLVSFYFSSERMEKINSDEMDIPKTNVFLIVCTDILICRSVYLYKPVLYCGPNVAFTIIFACNSLLDWTGDREEWYQKWKTRVQENKKGMKKLENDNRNT